MRQACPVPSDVLPAVVEVVRVPVGDHHAAGRGQVPNSANDFRVRRPRKNKLYSSVTAASTNFLVPAGPHRSVVSSNPATAAAVISVTTSAIPPAAPARQE